MCSWGRPRTPLAFPTDSCQGVARVGVGLSPTHLLLTDVCLSPTPHPCHTHQRAGPAPLSLTASSLRRQLRCTTTSRRCSRVSCVRYACAGTAKRPTRVGKRVPGGERVWARRRSASWAALSLETAARWPCVPSPSPATTCRCSRPWGPRCIVQTDGQIGGLVQPTARGASELAQTLGIAHLTVMDRQTDSAAQGGDSQWPSRAGSTEMPMPARVHPKQQAASCQPLGTGL